MANKPLQSIKFPDLTDTYTIPVVDSTLAVSGAAADAKETGDGLADKVDKEPGKGLSTNDYTDEEKTKLGGVETGANKTVIDTTLTQIGQAADAKAVGDAIANEDKKALAAFATDTASGAVANFPDGADNIPMKDVLVHIEPVQAGSGDPSPDNVRPITGWTGCVISHSGADMTNPTTYDITFPSEAGTVYGGQLNVTTGELVVDRVIWTGNTADMNNSENYPGWRDAGIADIVGVGVTSGIPNAISNISPAFTSNKYAIGVNTRSATSTSTGTLFLTKDYFNKNQTEWKALALDIQVVLPLATPITYTLTPQEITSLLGTNNLWADTGNTEVEYRADAKLYITKKITEAVSALS